MHVTEDGQFSWVEVECLGACVNAPMVQIGSDYYEDLDADRFNKLLDGFAAGKPPKAGPQIDRQFSEPVGGATTLTDPSLYKNGKSTAKGETAERGQDAKKPGAAANVREAGTPKPPMRDKSRERKPKPN
jgi:NADH-quinone oxidoreductase subunit E